jgi:hypothetical protein
MFRKPKNTNSLWFTLLCKGWLLLQACLWFLENCRRSFVHLLRSLGLQEYRRELAKYPQHLLLYIPPTPSTSTASMSSDCGIEVDDGLWDELCKVLHQNPLICHLSILFPTSSTTRATTIPPPPFTPVFHLISMTQQSQRSSDLDVSRTLVSSTNMKVLTGQEDTRLPTCPSLVLVLSPCSYLSLTGGNCHIPLAPASLCAAEMV